MLGNIFFWSCNAVLKFLNIVFPRVYLLPRYDSADRRQYGSQKTQSRWRWLSWGTLLVLNDCYRLGENERDWSGQPISHSALEMIWQIVTSLFSRVEWQAGVSVESADTNSCSHLVSHYLRSKIQRRKGLFVSIYQTRNWVLLSPLLSSLISISVSESARYTFT